MEEISKIHPVAQVFVIIGVTVIISIAIWQFFKSLRES
jgi:hypothetical protein